jgi:effector-binding domain-containing protein
MDATAVREDVQEKVVEPVLFAGYRMRGRYEEIGSAIGMVARAAGRQVAGKPMALYYDPEHRTEGADFEGGFPVKRRVEGTGVDCRELPGGKAVTLVHHGPYDRLHDSYARIRQYLREKGYAPLIPSREVYIKGPGMILRGNPEKYVTEIQVLVV